jgi:hypothetical protein
VGGRDHIVAFSAFFVGLIYDQTALDAPYFAGGTPDPSDPNSMS